ncbi:mitochondrial inner membrane protease subunit [Cordyceps militaris]|uniref:Mitochondrial inner membrane protease subunit n=1 Tax=Cordyceps militaris TaxID=73501 RepID=A0A2H4S8K2_CORMI|nr:mitochondrial inner membrane protease subunit [Cordyceps militaris]
MAARFLQRPSVRISVGMTKLWFAWHLVATHGFQVDPADGPSMLPTFSTYGDWIGTDKRFRYGRGVRIGDLVLYQMPYAAHDMGVKRVTGLPGDYVSVGTPGQPGQEIMIQIPDGHCWIVGDNLVASRDSRTFGPLPLALIQGKVVAKVLPWNERQWFENPLQRVEQ